MCWMKTPVLVLPLAFGLVCGCSSQSARFGGYVGYEHREFKSVEHEHVTHPDDRAFLLGSPGTTGVASGEFARLGVRLASRDQLMEHLELKADVGMLAGGARDEKQNENDPRPADQGSFIYSELYPVAPEVAVGARYFVAPKLALGLDLNWAHLFVEHGWDRFGDDEKTDTDGVSAVSLGPTVAYSFGSVECELGAGFPVAGDGGWMIHLTITLPFWTSEKSEDGE